MLNDTIDDVMERTKKIERHNKTVRFSNVFKNMAVGNRVEIEIMKRKLSEFIKQETPVEINSDEISEYITENPEKAMIDLNLDYEPTGLPFFRSIRVKLQQVYGC